MTDVERLNVSTLLQALRVGEWVDGKCPRCHYSQARGHKCSCPVRVAVRNLSRAVGSGDLALEDDDLIVERAVRELATADEDGRRVVVRAAVDAAVAFGGRS